MNTKVLFSLITLVALAVWGCTKPEAPEVASSSPSSNTTHSHDGHDHDHDHGDGHDHGHGDHEHGDAGTETVAVALHFCGSCGHAFKGDEHQCDEGHEKCEACGLHKGSELCCKLEGDFAGKTLCGKCGQVAGTDACCKEGAEACAHCKLAKGSPLCCKLADAAEEASEAEGADPAPAETSEESSS